MSYAHALESFRMGTVSRRHLPPLNTLRGFEAAARHLSFTLAAQELHLTQGAVSRQVRDLERFLGKSLFRRMIRRVALTEEGRQFHAVVEHALAEIEEVADSIQNTRRRHQLTVSALPTLCSLWLMPRLHLFTQKCPNVDVNLIASIEPADLLAHDADVAIRVGRLPGRRYLSAQPRIALDMVVDWSGVQAEELFPDILVPVCSPSILNKEGRLFCAELLRMPLIQTSSRPDAWADWLCAQGMVLTEPLQYAYEFGHFFMSLDAAREQAGVAIIPTAIWMSYPKQDELVAPVGNSANPAVSSAGEYYLLSHRQHRNLAHVREFRAWILEEAALLQAGA